MSEWERSLLNIFLMDALAQVPMNISSCFASVDSCEVCLQERRAEKGD